MELDAGPRLLTTANDNEPLDVTLTLQSPIPVWTRAQTQSSGESTLLSPKLNLMHDSTGARWEAREVDRSEKRRL